MSIFDEQKQETIFQVGIDETSKSYMLETARWTKFLAIMGFIGMGLMIAVGIFYAAFSSTLGSVYSSALGADFGRAVSSGIVFVYIFLAILYFYPTYALLKFSTLTKAALNTGDQQKFQEGFRFQRNLFKYIGIMMLVILAFYGIMLLGVAAMAVFR